MTKHFTLTSIITQEQIDEVISILRANCITVVAKQIAEIYWLNNATVLSRCYSIIKWMRQKPKNFFPIYYYLKTGEKLEFNKPTVRDNQTVEIKKEAREVAVNKKPTKTGLFIKSCNDWDFTNPVLIEVNPKIEPYLNNPNFTSELQSFWMYWSEKSENWIKQRFEKEKTFCINRRLATWFKNKQDWNNTTKPKVWWTVEM